MEHDQVYSHCKFQLSPGSIICLVDLKIQLQNSFLELPLDQVIFSIFPYPQLAVKDALPAIYSDVNIKVLNSNLK